MQREALPEPQEDRGIGRDDGAHGCGQDEEKCGLKYWNSQKHLVGTTVTIREPGKQSGEHEQRQDRSESIALYLSEGKRHPRVL